MKNFKKILLGVLMLVLLTGFSKQSFSQSSKYGNDSISCVTNLSLYRDYYRQWQSSDYQNRDMAMTAYKYWRLCVTECPKSSQNLYPHGIKMIEYRLQNCADSSVLQTYVDTLMWVYDLRVEHFGDNPKFPVGYLRGRQAVDLLQYRKNAAEQYYPLFKESFTLMQNETEPNVLYGYFIAAVQYWKAGKCDIDLVFNTYMEVNDALQYNINSKPANEADNYSKVLNKLEPIMVQIATCDKLISVFESKFDANPTDTILARNLVRLFELRKCTKENLYFKALEQVHKIAPNSQSAYSMGLMSVEREMYDQAKDYLLQAISITPDSLSDRKADTYLLLADVYNKSGNSVKSREAAREVLKIRSDDAFAYLIIGELYVKAANSCLHKDMPVTYWLAADYFAKAANVAKDEKVKEAAQKQLNAVRRSFPIQQDIFMRNLTEGQSFMVECWINESTIIRAR